MAYQSPDDDFDTMPPWSRLDKFAASVCFIALFMLLVRLIVSFFTV